jgi:hypothetical protein
MVCLVSRSALEISEMASSFSVLLTFFPLGQDVLVSVPELAASSPVGP